MSATAQTASSAPVRDTTPNAMPNRIPGKVIPDVRWLRTLYQVHWISAAICLVLLILFAMTGVVMNHSAVFKTEPVIVRQELRIPEPLLSTLAATAASGRSAANRSDLRGDSGREQGTPMTLPSAVSAWLTQQFAFEMARAETRLQGDTVRVTRREPGQQWIASFNLHSGVVKHEATDRGWLAYLTDLHKAKSAGDAWRWFVDFFAFGVLVFALSGLWILKQHAPRRRAVWPTVALGVALPVAVILLFVR